MGAFANEAERNRELLGNRVRPRRFRHCAEVGTESVRDLCVLRAAQDDVISLLVESRQAKQDVSDVRADAEVVELARIDRYPHRQDSVRSTGKDWRSALPTNKERDSRMRQFTASVLCRR